ncbi:ribosomal oxygenase 2 isoform X2 [Ixodes scapularis]|uniref:ribosomal oxygenase 2 isoform X2 n=1 Tax=Ixodes scapularis TaxID=6945 RepID=UPI001A9FBC55|nr:ribosomal oxygenase 2 isoform X2 [Ixodes scapularis]
MNSKRSKVPKAPKAGATYKKRKTSDHDTSSDEEVIPTALPRKFGTPLEFMEFLLSPLSYKEFSEKYWEREPFVAHDRAGMRAFWPQLFSKDAFFSIAKETKLYFGKDVSACKYEDGKRSDYAEGYSAKSAKLNKYFEERKATLQVHQPQRWKDSLWEVLELMECFFGCLVGCNAYITPAGSQGLAPHHDDVEVFIVQLEGEKCWKLHKPVTELARIYSKDFTSEEIGEPTHEFTLRPGDFLYMPRGTIHHAYVPESADSHSTHITISTYQKQTVGDCLMDIAPDLISSAMDSCIELRKGLPNRFLPSCVLSKETVVTALSSVLEHVKQMPDEMPSPEEMVRDFMFSRLPPFGFDRRNTSMRPYGDVPHLNDRVKLAYPDHCTYLTEYSDEDEEDNALLVTSVYNKREEHMMSSSDAQHEEESAIIKLPINLLDGVKQLCESEDFVSVKALEAPCDEDRLFLALALWTRHLLKIQYDAEPE